MAGSLPQFQVDRGSSYQFPRAEITVPTYQGSKSDCSVPCTPGSPGGGTELMSGQWARGHTQEALMRRVKATEAAPEQQSMGGQGRGGPGVTAVAAVCHQPFAGGCLGEQVRSESSAVMT